MGAENVGVSQRKPSGSLKHVGKEMVKEAREDGGIEDEAFGVLFTSSDFNFKSLVEGVESEISSDWIGGTTVAEISSKGSNDRSAVLMLVETDSISFDTVITSPVSEGAEDAARDAVEEISKSINDDKNKLLYTLVPGFTMEKDGREFEVLKGLEKELDREIKITGGSTGDSHNLKENYQIRNGEVYADRAVMTLIQTDKKIVTRQEHGFKESIKTGVITESEGRVVKKIGDQPAAEFYAEAIGEDISKLNGMYDTKWNEKISIGLYYLYLKLRGKHPNMFDEILHYSLENAIGHQMRPGEYRIIAPIEIKEGGIKLMDSVQEGQTIEILTTDKQSVIEAGKQAFSDLDRDKVLFGLVNDCANRHLILDEDERKKEVQNIVDQLGQNFIGFYGEGEIGDSGNGICTFMSQTLTGFVILDE